MCGIFFHNLKSEYISTYFLNSLNIEDRITVIKKYLDNTIGHTLLSIRGDVENSKQFK